MTLVMAEGFEHGTVGPWGSLSANCLVLGTTKKTGGYAVDANPPTTTAAAAATFNGLGTNGTRDTSNGYNVNDLYVSFDVQFGNLPGASNETFFGSNIVAGTTLIRLRISSGGLVSLYDPSATLIATGSTALSAGVWYRMDVRLCGSATSSYEVKIDGVTEFSGTFAQSGGNVRSFNLGKVVNSNSQQIRCYFDNVFADDAAYVSNSAVVLGLPVDSDGSTQQWASGTGASNYTQVDEIPATVSDYVKCSTAGNQVALFGFASCASAGISGTILGALFAILIREETSVTSANAVRVRSGGNNYDSANYNGSTTLESRGSFRIVDPATSVAWTTTGLDAVEAGSIETNTVAMLLGGVIVQVAFIPTVSQDEESDALNLTGAGIDIAQCDRDTKLAGVDTGRGLTTSQCDRDMKANGVDTGRGSDVAATNSAHNGNGNGSGRGAASALSSMGVTSADRLVGSGTASALSAMALTSAALLAGSGRLSSRCIEGDVGAGLCSGKGRGTATSSSAHNSQAVDATRGQAIAACALDRESDARARDRAGRVDGLTSHGGIARGRATGAGRGTAVLADLEHQAHGVARGRGTGSATESKGGSANGQAIGRGRATSRCVAGHSSAGLATGRGRLRAAPSKGAISAGPMSAAGRSSALCRMAVRLAGRASGRGRLSGSLVRAYIARAYLFGRSGSAAAATPRTDYLAIVVRRMELILDAELYQDADVVLDAEPFHPEIEVRPTL